MAPEVSAVVVARDREGRARDGRLRAPLVPGTREGFPEGAYLVCLLDVERSPVLREQQRRTDEVHALLSCPDAGLVRPGSPPDPRRETGAERSDGQVRLLDAELRGPVRPGHGLPGDRPPEEFRLGARVVGPRLVLSEVVPEAGLSVGGLLGAAPAHP